MEHLLKRHLEKAERENGFIYHHKVPDDCPLLDADANYGVAKAEPYSLPKPSPVSHFLHILNYFNNLGVDPRHLRGFQLE